MQCAVTLTAGNSPQGGPEKPPAGPVWRRSRGDLIEPQCSPQQEEPFAGAFQQPGRTQPSDRVDERESVCLFHLHRTE